MSDSGFGDGPGTLPLNSVLTSGFGDDDNWQEDPFSAASSRTNTPPPPNISSPPPPIFSNELCQATPPTTPEKARKAAEPLPQNTPTTLGKLLKAHPVVAAEKRAANLGELLKVVELRAEYKSWTVSAVAAKATAEDGELSKGKKGKKSGFSDKEIDDHVSRCVKVASLFTMRIPQDAMSFAESRENTFKLMFSEDKSYILCLYTNSQSIQVSVRFDTDSIYRSLSI